MTRLFAIGLLLVAISPAGPLAAQSDQVWLLRDDALQDKITVSVAHQPEQVLVYVHRGSTPDGVVLPEMAIQAWVLKADGTALSKYRPGQKVMTWGTQSNGWTTWSTIFNFERVNPRDLAAVVVSLDGTLLVRPISQKPAN